MASFMTQFLLFIGASLLFVPLFKKFGFGSVLGYLIAGMIIGPSGAGWISDAESVLHFAELGVVLLLFIIGLEVQPHKLKSMGKQLFGLGAIQVIASTVCFAFIAKLSGLTLIASTVVGFAFSLSSTAFAIQTLHEKNQFNTEHGQAAFSVLLMQDFLAIPALALIPALGNVAFNLQSALKTLMALLGLVVALIVARKFFIKPLFRAIASTRAREMFTAMTLFIVVGVATLMQNIGLSAALGTFLAGVLLAESEYRHELETNLEPFKGLLMGLFFIAVGMEVNLHLIVSYPLQIVSATLGYILLKGAILYLVGRNFKLQHENSKLMALSISQGGEFAFVLFGLVLKYGLATSFVVEALTAMVTISMAISPILSEVYGRWLCKSKKTIIPTYDTVDESEVKVIIAGFGRFGQIFGRVLKAQGISFVAIDHDPDNIEILRKFGNKVYYGDVTRLDLLESAGAAKATHFVLAIDDVETSIVTAKIVREHFPKLKIFARARNRGHSFRLMEEGIEHIKRETFDSSINFVFDLLKDMGMEEDVSRRIVARFKAHDEAMLQEQFKVHKDDSLYVSVSNQNISQLSQVFEDEKKQSYLAPADSAPQQDIKH